MKGVGSGRLRGGGGGDGGWAGGGGCGSGGDRLDRDVGLEAGAASPTLSVISEGGGYRGLGSSGFLAGSLSFLVGLRRSVGGSYSGGGEEGGDALARPGRSKGRQCMGFFREVGGAGPCGRSVGKSGEGGERGAHPDSRQSTLIPGVWLELGEAAVDAGEGGGLAEDGQGFGDAGGDAGAGDGDAEGLGELADGGVVGAEVEGGGEVLEGGVDGGRSPGG